MNAPFFLRFTNTWDDRWTEQRGSVHFFVALGDFWPQSKHPNRRLIRETTRDIALAHEFSTVEACRETLALCGQPKDWEIVDKSGAVVE